MFKLENWFNSRLKVLLGISLFLLIILLGTYLTGKYFEKTIADNWQNISDEKSSQIKDECFRLFNTYQHQASDFSKELITDKKFLSAIASQNTKKSYESLFEHEKIEDYSVEIYNSRLELFLFSGRQLNPEVLELQKALSGERFTTVKEIGFYTYIIVYEPIHYDQNTRELQQSRADGVLLTAKLLDVRYDIKNEYFRNTGITQDIDNEFHIKVDFDFKQNPVYGIMPDTEQFSQYSRYELKNINGSIIGKVIIPKLDESSYILNVKDNFFNFIVLQIFILNIILFLVLFYYLKNVRYEIIRVIAFIVFLIASRYLWLVLNFPSRLFPENWLDIFSPSHYASGVAFGIARSIGDLLITSLVLLVICSYILSPVLKSVRTKIEYNKSVTVILTTLLFAVIIMCLQIYGVIIQALVFDSNLNYFSRSQIISTENTDLLIVQIAILIISISLVLVLLCCGLSISKYFNALLFKEKSLFKKHSIVLVFVTVILLNLLFEILGPASFVSSLRLNLRLLITVLAGIYCYYVYRQVIVGENFKFSKILNISILIFVCAIFVPIVLLNKITSQENKYLELVARNISDKSDDKINFLLMSSAEDISDNTNLESDILNKNKYAKLAFTVWSESKLYTEDLNTAVFILDTSRRVISDFNINPSELISDSVVNFAVRNIIKPRTNILKNEESTDEQTFSGITDEDTLTGDVDKVLKNTDSKFYCSIKSIEKTDLKNSKYNRKLGYVIIAAQYDSKNYPGQSSMQIFKSSMRDNLINKLTSVPVISEYTDGELTGFSDRDVSKAFTKSLEPFRESVKDKIDKSALRYDEFENHMYKSYYVLTTQGNTKANMQEKIYIVSVKMNDFGLVTFFIFKYLLFVVILYLIFITVYLLYKLVEYFSRLNRRSTFYFGFREKLFASFLIVSVIPIIVLAVYSREYVRNKNNEFYNNQLISDLRIVEQYVKHRLSAFNFSKMSSSGGGERSTSFSNVFGREFAESHKNFNLYGRINLIATTDEQLYKSDLLDTRIDGNAFYNIVLLKKDYYKENRDIGTLSIIEGYKPMYDNYNNLVGIISSQTVFKQNEIDQELTESLVYIFGVYFIAVIFLILIVNILSYKISNPIIKLQKATEMLSKGDTEIQVESNTKDEIGELVRLFNKMTIEIKRSRVELKKAERESAWRDIARQVAHEIKNPLTPMKLAMQHLYHSYTKGSQDFKSTLQTTNRLIIDQIETLNKIASEFSDFAKMPSRNYQPLNVDLILQDVVNLMNTDNKITLTLRGENEKHRILGDKDELARAFMNIIRNSLQAIDEKISNKTGGKVEINTISYNGYYLIKIKDNGIGMDDESLQSLFEPYFSTKSTGMGLGLVITKKIIDDMSGKIYVRSELYKGTEVEIRFEILKN